MTSSDETETAEERNKKRAKLEEEKKERKTLPTKDN